MQRSAPALITLCVLSVSLWFMSRQREHAAPSPAEGPSAPAAELRPNPGAPQVIYGPPAPPPPIYGPPTPPSRTPLLDLSGPLGHSEIMPVEQGAVVPTPGRAEEASAVGWDALDLDRGIPFMPDRPKPAPSEGVAPGAEARRTLFQRAAPDPAPVSIAYCVDPAVGQASPQILQAVAGALRRCAAKMGKQDRLALVVADAEGRVPAPMTTAADAQVAERIGSAASQITPTPPGALAPALRRALTLEGVTHVIVIASAGGQLGPEDERWFSEQAKTTGGPRLIALMVGDRAAAPRAVALRSLAVRTSGAFAWLRAAD